MGASTCSNSSVLWNVMHASIKISTRRSSRKKRRLLRNRRGTCSEIEEASVFSKVGPAQKPRADTFPDLSAPVTRNLSFAQITGHFIKDF
ncbi:hypothetical protein TB1_017958 [Malus domestica]